MGPFQCGRPGSCGGATVSHAARRRRVGGRRCVNCRFRAASRPIGAATTCCGTLSDVLSSRTCTAVPLQSGLRTRVTARRDGDWRRTPRHETPHSVAARGRVGERRGLGLRIERDERVDGAHIPERQRRDDDRLGHARHPPSSDRTAATSIAGRSTSRPSVNGPTAAVSGAGRNVEAELERGLAGVECRLNSALAVAAAASTLVSPVYSCTPRARRAASAAPARDSPRRPAGRPGPSTRANDGLGIDEGPHAGAAAPRPRLLVAA